MVLEAKVEPLPSNDVLNETEAQPVRTKKQISKTTLIVPVLLVLGGILAGTLVSYQKGLSGSFTNGTHVTNGTNTYINQEDTDVEPDPVRFKYIYNRDFPGMDLPLKLFSQVVDSIDNCTAMCNVGCDFVTYDAEKLCSIKYTDKIAYTGTVFKNQTAGWIPGILRNVTLISETIQESFETCKTLCENTDSCNFFNYEEIGKRSGNSTQVKCQLKDFQSAPNVIIAFKDNPIPLNSSPKRKGRIDVLGSVGVVCMHVNLLPNGKILCSARPEYRRGGPNYEAVSRPNLVPYGEMMTVFDPISRTFITSEINDNIFCHGAILMEDGNLFSSGGDDSGDIWLASYPNLQRDPSVALQNGLKKQRIYHTRNNTWTYLRDLIMPRWYPTPVRLESGIIFSFGGSKDGGDPMIMMNDFDIYDPSKNEQILVNSALFSEVGYSLYPVTALIPGSGNIWVCLNTLWAIYDKTTGEEIERQKNFPGNVRPGPYPVAGCLLPLLPENGYEGEYIFFGGVESYYNKTAIDTVVRLKLGPYTSKFWTDDTDRMPYGRITSDAVMQPNGKILIVNGARLGETGGGIGRPYMKATANDIFCYDPFMPAGKKFQVFATTPIQRLYHSSAIFIPDGRTLLVGTDQATFTAATSYEHRAEAFTPPWLLNGVPRPEIHSVQEILKYGQEFTVSYSGNVTNATILTPSGATHGVEFTQRIAFLTIISKFQNQIVLRAPPNATVLLQGYHMLFLLNGDTPSLAKWIQLKYLEYD